MVTGSLDNFEFVLLKQGRIVADDLTIMGHAIGSHDYRDWNCWHKLSSEDSCDYSNTAQIG